jgi:hypothetical protein
MRSMLVVAAVAAIAVTAAQTAEKPVELKRGAGSNRVAANCGGCHSLDYIRMNAGFLDAAGWDAEIAKMIRAFGAPIDPADAKAIAAYLSTNYGSRPPPGGPGGPEASGPHQRNEARVIRPRAALRRHAEAKGSLASFFSLFAEAWPCKSAKAEKHRARAAGCEDQTKHASDPGKRQARWLWEQPRPRRTMQHS